MWGDPTVLLRVAERALEHFRGTALRPVPEPRTPGVVVTPAAWADLIEPAADELRAAIDEVVRERREAEVTLRDKNAALAAYDETFEGLASLLVGTFTAAGMEELAERVRPSRARRGRTNEEGPEGEPFPPPSPAPTSAAAAGGPA
jgi:hypothetical protein